MQRSQGPVGVQHCLLAGEKSPEENQEANLNWGWITATKVSSKRIRRKSQRGQGMMAYQACQLQEKGRKREVQRWVEGDC